MKKLLLIPFFIFILGACSPKPIIIHGVHWGKTPQEDILSQLGIGNVFNETFPISDNSIIVINKMENPQFFNARFDGVKCRATDITFSTTKVMVAKISADPPEYWGTCREKMPTEISGEFILLANVAEGVEATIKKIKIEVIYVP